MIVLCLQCDRAFQRKPKQRRLCCSAACTAARHRATRDQRSEQTSGSVRTPLDTLKEQLADAEHKLWQQRGDIEKLRAPSPMRLPCPACSALHLDVGEFETKPHHTHACQHCGNVWRPAIIATVGVQFLPGFKN